MENEEVEKLKLRGNIALRERKYFDALDFYSRAIKLDPNNHLLYFDRSHCLNAMRAERSDEAAEDALKCIELAPDFDKGYVELGIAYYHEHKFKDAHKVFVDFLDKFPMSDMVTTIKEYWLTYTIHREIFIKGIGKQRCSNCGKICVSSDYFPCPGCLFFIRYCCKECQLEHWNRVHKFFCGASNAMKNTQQPWVYGGYKRKIDTKTSFKKIWSLALASKFDEAVVESQRILRLIDDTNESYPEILFSLAHSLAKSGRIKEALVAFFRVNPLTFKGILLIHYVHSLICVHEKIHDWSTVFSLSHDLFTVVSEATTIDVNRNIPFSFTVYSSSIVEFISNNSKITTDKKKLLLSDSFFLLREATLYSLEHENDQDLAMCYESYVEALRIKIQFNLYEPEEIKDAIVSDIIWYSKRIYGIYETSNDYKRMNNCNFELAAMYFDIGNYEKAIILQLQILEYSKNTNDIGRRTSCVHTIGNIYKTLKDYERALSYYRDAIKLYKQIGYTGLNYMHAIGDFIDIVATSVNVIDTDIVRESEQYGKEMIESLVIHPEITYTTAKNVEKRLVLIKSKQNKK